MNALSSSKIAGGWGAVCLILLSSSGATACPACYGDTTGSKMGVAASWGVIAMVIIMFFMLGAVGAFIYYLSYRARHPLPDYEELFDEGYNTTGPEAS